MNKTRITIDKGLKLGSAGGRPLLGDLYLPVSGSGKARPSVVLVFGGGWRSGERAQQKVYGINLAQAGFVCLATDYRWSTEAVWPAQLEDVQAAIRWLRKNAADHSIDPGRIGISGNSSGGHLALMAAAAAADPSLAPQSAESAEYPAAVSAVCAFYPPVRLAGLDEESRDDTVATLMGPDATRADFERASPISHAALPLPPLLLLAGGADKRVPVGHSYELKNALERAGNRVDFHVFADQEHAFDVQLGFAQLCAVIMADFFRRTL